jgi:predicted nucleic acid-binding protein
MNALHFLDSNILLYSISRDPLEAPKQERARQLLDQDNGALSIQVLQEFYVQSTRPTRIDPLPHDLAVAFIGTWMRFQIQEMTISVFKEALEIKRKDGLSYWDSAIVSAASALNCATLYSEDMQHQRQIGQVRILNPFL